MSHANAARATPRKPFAFRRDRLPNPAKYFREQDLKLIGGGTWKSAACPFHDDTRPSLRVHMERGAFKCMTCGAKGGDVLAFHMRRHGLSFIDAVKTLGAWEPGP
ncbi:MAG: CHC2 zinc finger domain-containing protein [Gammaproteobacteria bacterium]